MQPIIQHLFQESSLENVSRQRLESFVAEYPFFGIGHYLLSRKLQAEGDESFAEKTQLTNLYFSNPFWLQWLLETSDSVARDVVVTEPRSQWTSYPPLSAMTEEETKDVLRAIEQAQATESSTEEEPIVKDTMESVVEQSLMEASQPSSDHQPVSMVELAESMHAVEEPTAAELLLQSIEEAKNLRENLNKINEDLGTGKVIPEPEVQVGSAAVHAPEAEYVQASTEVPEAVMAPEVTSSEEPIKDEEAPFVLEEVDTVAVQTGMEEPEQKTVSPEQGFVFEPYHTIDYFASQGIKLKLDDHPTDQLGKQLKSFTDWLKVMRKLPQKEREIVADRVTEETIQTIAAHSVVGREIVTETMAEVLAKQGMPERARAVYEKLSLLNPDKRAYFATKIEQLNNQ